MNNTLTYNGFIGSVQFSTDDDVFFGKIEGINDLITFEGDSVSILKKAFKEAVDDYLELCKDNNLKPHKSYTGSFNVRISPKLHGKAVMYATCSGMNLNQFIQQAIEYSVKKIGKTIRISSV